MSKANGTNPSLDAHQYEELMRSLDGIVWEADAVTLRHTFVSQQAERLLGYAAERWLTPGFWADHLHPDDRGRVEGLYRQASRQPRKCDLEYRMVAADGRAVWLRDIITVVAEGEGKLRGIMVDITDQKRAEEALREREGLYRLLDESSNDLIYLLDLDGRVVYASPSAGRRLGHVPRDRFEIVHPDDVAPVQACWERVVGGKSELIAVRVADAAGAWRWLEAWSSLIDHQGRPHVLAVCRDVTDRKQAEERLRESEQRMRAIVDTEPECVKLLGPDGALLDMNPAGLRMIEAESLQEVRGRCIYSLVAERHRPAFRELNERVFSGGAGSLEFEVVGLKGGRRWLETHATPLRDEAGRTVAALSVTREITERKRAEEALIRSNELLRSFVEHTPAAVAMLDRGLRYVAVSRRWLQDYRLGEQDIVGRHHYDVFPEIRALPEWQAIHDRCLTGAVERREEDWFVRADGTEDWIRWEVRPWLDDTGAIGGIIMFTEVITERKRAEATLRESEANLNRAQAVAHIGSWYLDLSRNELTWSDENYRVFGIAPGTPLTYETFLAVVHPDDRATVDQAWGAALRGSAYDIEHRIVVGGNTRWVREKAELIRGLDGRALTGIGITHDITDRKRAEEAVRDSEARFRTFVDHAADAFFLMDAQANILDVNRRACESLGYARGELIGKTPLDFDAAVDKAALDGLLARLDAGEELAFDTRHRRKCGAEFPVEIRVRPFREGGRRFAVALVRDITERRRADEALRESFGLFNAVIEGTSDIVFVKDLRGRYLMINSAGARFLGQTVDEVIGKDDRALFAAETAERVMEADRQVLASASAQMFEFTATAAGQTRTIQSTKGPYRDAHGRVIGLVGIARDVTEMRRLEEQFRQAQKMEAVGRLASGVAHDFNNLLCVINGYSEMVFGRLHPDDPNREFLAAIGKSGERAADLTRQLLAFSRKSVLQPQVVNLNVLLDDLLKLLKRLIGADVELALAPDAGLGLAMVDPGQFGQAVMNLAVNARDAMPGGGRLTIETCNAELDAAYAERHPEAKPGRYVRLAATDTGHGMDEATKARIFEPFFTTKGPGKGTGLGLAMVFGFAKQSGGHVEVDSEPGRGTTFRVYLPRADAVAPAAKSSPSAFKTLGGNETVLLAEDDEAVRRLALLVLRSCGYTVLDAGDGVEAIRAAQEHRGPIHLLLTDLVMPRMSGRQLIDLLAKSRPGMRILLMSGYTDEAVPWREVPAAGVALLQKPFSTISLARKVRETLDADEL